MLFRQRLFGFFWHSRPEKRRRDAVSIGLISASIAVLRWSVAHRLSASLPLKSPECADLCHFGLFPMRMRSSVSMPSWGADAASAARAFCLAHGLHCYNSDGHAVHASRNLVARHGIRDGATTLRFGGAQDRHPAFSQARRLCGQGYPNDHRARGNGGVPPASFRLRVDGRH